MMTEWLIIDVCGMRNFLNVLNDLHALLKGIETLKWKRKNGEFVCIQISFCRCRELKLIDRCVQLTPRDGTANEILTKHTKEHYDLLKTTSQCTDEEKLEELSSKFDAIYIHPVS